MVASVLWKGCWVKHFAERKLKLMSSLNEALRATGSHPKMHDRDECFSTSALLPEEIRQGVKLLREQVEREEVVGTVAAGRSTIQGRLGRQQLAGDRGRSPEEVVFLKAR